MPAHHHVRLEDPVPATRTRRRFGAAALGVAVTAAASAISPQAATAVVATSAVTARVSVDAAGASGGDVGQEVLVDKTGRFVAFTSGEPFAAADTNGAVDVYVRDRLAGVTTLVTRRTDGAPVTAGGYLCGMSDDARFVAFKSDSPDLSAANGETQVYLRDRLNGSTHIVSVSTNGVPAAAPGVETAGPCDVSDSGRYVAFASSAANLVPGDTKGFDDVFRRDRNGTGATERISVSGAGAEADGPSSWPSMSGDGTVVAFESEAKNLVGADTNGVSDVFLRMPAVPATARTSVRGVNVQLDGASGSPSISNDGSLVAFDSLDGQIQKFDSNDAGDVFVRDRVAQSTSLASVSPDGVGFGPFPDKVSRTPSISNDGRFVGFDSEATNLDPHDNNGTDDAYVYDRVAKVVRLVSRTTKLAKAGNGYSGPPTVSDDGTVAAFASSANDLVRNDEDAKQPNGPQDAFVRALGVEVTPFATFDAFMAQQHQDFEGRAPTPAEQTEWSTRLSNGESTPPQAIDELAHGTTWSGRRAPVTRLYWAFFLRVPDLVGLGHWVDQVQSGKSMAWVASQFAKSAEFTDTYGSLSNGAFVTLVYQNVLDRDPEPGGLAYWTKKLDDKVKTRGDVMVGFSESAEAKRRLAPQVDTVLIWLGLLRGLPTKAQFATAVAYLRDVGPPEGLVEALLATPEYVARF
ncbi:MAG: domain protein beta Propeller [Acidimicrobiales bacterium]|nr:domain protein beta Propeller [Acidimicrobiales bacterium]